MVFYSRSAGAIYTQAVPGSMLVWSLVSAGKTEEDPRAQTTLTPGTYVPALFGIPPITFTQKRENSLNGDS